MKAINRLSLFILLLGIILNISAQNYYANNHRGIENKTDIITTNTTSDDDVKNKRYVWEFDSSVPSTFDNNTIQKAEEHEFGSKVACFKVLMEEYYVTQEEVVPGDPMRRTIIKKPNIYNTTRKIEKHLKKEVKRGNIPLEKAINDFTHILEVSLTIINEADTEAFEEALDRNKKSIEDQISIFNQVKINNIY
ncbi:hypothetical protein [Dysgonomonas termitidis]|uniref:Uncharacterized protein n=1 Tax=Dysgonomonas termitidis TaxID=1516126 RepID=A0ABV9KWP4_9BACT